MVTLPILFLITCALIFVFAGYIIGYIVRTVTTQTEFDNSKGLPLPNLNPQCKPNNHIWSEWKEVSRQQGTWLWITLERKCSCCGWIELKEISALK